MQRNKPPILIDEIQKAPELLSYIKEAVDAADGTGSFWLTGSFPGIRALPDDLRAGGYESYIETYIMRDIRDLAQVGDELKFRRFMTACAALTARPVVYADLARMADIDEKTAKTWLFAAGEYLSRQGGQLLCEQPAQALEQAADPAFCRHRSCGVSYRLGRSGHARTRRDVGVDF